MFISSPPTLYNIEFLAPSSVCRMRTESIGSPIALPSEPSTRPGTNVTLHLIRAHVLLPPAVITFLGLDAAPALNSTHAVMAAIGIERARIRGETPRVTLLECNRPLQLVDRGPGSLPHVEVLVVVLQVLHPVVESQLLQFCCP